MSAVNKTALYVILAAFITGLFAIAPKLYDIITEPRARLIYAVTNGPELVAGNQCRRITSVRVLNAGKRALHNVRSEIKLPIGEFESFRVEESTGLHPKVSNSKTVISADISTLHSGEAFIVVVMELIPSSKVVAELNVRSDEVLGTQESKSGDKKTSPEIVSAILASFSVLAMSLIVAFRLLHNNREDTIFYILVRTGLTELSDEIKFSASPLTYWRTADILLDLGLRQDEQIRAKCLKALKCMLIIGAMAPASRKVIEGNIQKLAGDSFSEQEVDKIKGQSVTKFDPRIRERIDNYLGKPESFV